MTGCDILKCDEFAHVALSQLRGAPDNVLSWCAPTAEAIEALATTTGVSRCSQKDLSHASDLPPIRGDDLAFAR